MNQNLFSIIIFFLFCIFDVHSTEIQPTTEKNPISHHFHNSTSDHQWLWRKATPVLLLDKQRNPSIPFVLSGILTYISAAISSAGGTGGGGLYISILTIVAGLDLKTASGFSAFMVTGGSVANVFYYMFSRNPKKGEKSLINYDIALLAQPLILLGVSFGVLCNLMLPEWLIAILFVGFLGFCTFKTFKSGIKHWRRETDMNERLRNEVECSCGNVVIPLLATKVDETEESENSSWRKLGMLVVIWFSFLVLYLLNGGNHGQGLIHIKACGTAYWIIFSLQIPLACIFTAWIWFHLRRKAYSDLKNNANNDTRSLPFEEFSNLPVLAFLVGYLGGVFGIGGGMLVSPLLLQMGLEPVMTAATCSFMVFFSSTMSSIQYYMFGMKQVEEALIYSTVCFAASVTGLTLVQRAIMKHGRASLVVFSVAVVLVLSTLLMAGYGVVNTWRDYITGQYMGFKRPC